MIQHFPENHLKKIIQQSQTDHRESGWITQNAWNNYLFNLRYNLCSPNENTNSYTKENRLDLNSIRILIHIYIPNPNIYMFTMPY